MRGFIWQLSFSEDEVVATDLTRCWAMLMSKGEGKGQRPEAELSEGRRAATEAELPGAELSNEDELRQMEDGSGPRKSWAKEGRKETARG
ncbi:hypothetical protein GUJ93_ZPchr0007g3970 [Zizania palustris]|uniref:Uncharacterized protein n=1 Tax=Zizania palustris TaxID=103762 RepID=A0A8J5TDN4_ZIZPA|nr:hypothetical protein GUJ93_ZPchr0007g3970 [Zizania palustris]